MMIFEKLGEQHDRQAFDCGDDAINRYLHTMASQHTKKGIARIHVITQADAPAQIVGFYSLSATNLHIGLKGYPDNIPAMLIGRLGVDKRFQKQGISKLLLSHALKTVKRLSQEAGIAFLVVHAKNQSLADYYTRFGFEPTNANPLQLILSVSSISP